MLTRLTLILMISTLSGCGFVDRLLGKPPSTVLPAGTGAGAPPSVRIVLCSYEQRVIRIDHDLCQEIGGHAMANGQPLPRKYAHRPQKTHDSVPEQATPPSRSAAHRYRLIARLALPAHTRNDGLANLPPPQHSASLAFAQQSSSIAVKAGADSAPARDYPGSIPSESDMSRQMDRSAQEGSAHQPPLDEKITASLPTGAAAYPADEKEEGKKAAKRDGYEFFILPALHSFDLGAYENL